MQDHDPTQSGLSSNPTDPDVEEKRNQEETEQGESKQNNKRKAGKTTNTVSIDGEYLMQLTQPLIEIV